MILEVGVVLKDSDSGGHGLQLTSLQKFMLLLAIRRCGEFVTPEVAKVRFDELPPPEDLCPEVSPFSDDATAKLHRLEKALRKLRRQEIVTKARKKALRKQRKQIKIAMRNI